MCISIRNAGRRRQHLQAQSFSFEDVVRYQEWLHAEDVFDETVREQVLPTLEQDWHERVSRSYHDVMSLTLAYLVEDAGDSTSPNVCDATNKETMNTLVADAARFKKDVLRRCAEDSQLCSTSHA